MRASAHMTISYVNRAFLLDEILLSLFIGSHTIYFCICYNPKNLGYCLDHRSACATPTNQLYLLGHDEMFVSLSGNHIHQSAKSAAPLPIAQYISPGF